MKKRYMIVRLQEPTLKLEINSSNINSKEATAEFIVGQKVIIKDSEEEALEELEEILNGYYATDLKTLMPSDHGFTIIPFYQSIK